MEKIAALQLVECPRDAMQGWPQFIPTESKIRYLNALLMVGYHTLDFGSFVSHKAIPQMADSRQVLEALDLSATSTNLLAIVANTRGAIEAAEYDAIRFLGFPFSVSPTFQLRNTNSSMASSLETVEILQKICGQKQKELVIYLSMAFGNPYGDDWSAEEVFSWAGKIADLGVTTISLADTVGLANEKQVKEMTAFLIQELPSVRIGVHLHASAHNWEAKVDAAFRSGCRRFDSALRGIGGCPMAGDDLVGNLDTLNLLQYCKAQQIDPAINEPALLTALEIADELFRNHLP